MSLLQIDDKKGKKKNQTGNRVSSLWLLYLGTCKDSDKINVLYADLDLICCYPSQILQILEKN